MTTAATDRLTVIVPVRNDEQVLSELLDLLGRCELPALVVDAGDGSRTAACVGPPHAYIAAPASRGGQIAAGMQHAGSVWLWVVHADTRPSPRAIEWLKCLVATDTPAWGRFDVDLPGLKVVAGFMNWRSRLTKICTGDQAMFFHRDVLADIGGFPEQPLMEDIEVSKRLKQTAGSSFRAPRLQVLSSPRRWLRDGVVRTVLSMWLYRLRYYFGASPQQLARSYYRTKHDG